MIQKIPTFLFVILTTLIVFQSCEKGENEQKVSNHNGTESHHEGENCMNCHYSGGSGDGWFTVAGTVYDSLKTTPYPNSTVTLLALSNGVMRLAATIEVDAYGNFYTTQQIDFENELHVSVKGNLDSQDMHATIANGRCNSCHGASTDRIWVK